MLGATTQMGRVRDTGSVVCVGTTGPTDTPPKKQRNSKETTRRKLYLISKNYKVNIKFEVTY